MEEREEELGEVELGGEKAPSGPSKRRRLNFDKKAESDLRPKERERLS